MLLMILTLTGCSSEEVNKNTTNSANTSSSNSKQNNKTKQTI